MSRMSYSRVCCTPACRTSMRVIFQGVPCSSVCHAPVYFIILQCVMLQGPWSSMFCHTLMCHSSSAMVRRVLSHFNVCHVPVCCLSMCNRTPGIPFFYFHFLLRIFSTHVLHSFSRCTPPLRPTAVRPAAAGVLPAEIQGGVQPRDSSGSSIHSRGNGTMTASGGYQGAANSAAQVNIRPLG